MTGNKRNKTIINIILLAFAATAFPACDDLYHSAQKQIKSSKTVSNLLTIFGVGPAPYQARNLFFVDQDRQTYMISGNLVFSPAVDETRIDGYQLYFGNGMTPLNPGSPIGSVPPTAGADTYITIPPAYPIPVDATHLLICSYKYNTETLMNDLYPRPSALEIPDMVCQPISSSTVTNPKYLTVFNNRLYFTATPDAVDYYLYWYDGSIPNYAPGLQSYDTISTTGMCVYNNFLYLDANYGDTGFEIGHELLRCDISNNVSSFVDIMFGPGSSYPGYYASYNGRMYFQANNSEFSTSPGAELYWIDGSSCNLAVDLFPGENMAIPNSSLPEHMTACNNLLYFTANENGLGRNMYAFNGTMYPAQVVIPTFSPATDPQDLIAYNGKLFFTAYYDQDMTWSRQLYATITGMPFQTDVIHGGIWQKLNPSNLFVYNNRLFFAANDFTDGLDRELWVYDDRTPTASTYQFVELNPGATSSNPGQFAVYNNKLFFSADGGSGQNLWVYDETLPPNPLDPLRPNPRMVSPGMPLSPMYLKAYNNSGRNTLYFSASNGATVELWEYYIQ